MAVLLVKDTLGGCHSGPGAAWPETAGPGHGGGTPITPMPKLNPNPMKHLAMSKVLATIVG